MSSSNQPPRQRSGVGRRPLDALAVGALPFDASGPEEFELEPQVDDNVFEEADHGRRSGLRAWGTQMLTRAAWLGLAALLALGSAGLVAATSYAPLSSTRPELTSGADQALSDRLDAAIRELTLLDNEVIVLGDQARNLLANLAQVNHIGLDAAYRDGDAAVADVDTRAAALSIQLECKPWTNARDTELAKTYSQGMVDRYHQVCLAIDSVAPLAAAWVSMENGSKVAMQVADGIDAHDKAAADALQSATQGRYPDALAKLDEASASLADAQLVATNLALILDVSTLNEWLSRTSGMDDALRVLWQTMIDSKGRITKQVTAALKAVTAAKALLPGGSGGGELVIVDANGTETVLKDPGSSGVLQVVLYEMAGNLTADGISIETAKGKLGSALADLAGGTALGG
jgi:hypothetical protein